MMVARRHDAPEKAQTSPPSKLSLSSLAPLRHCSTYQVRTNFLNIKEIYKSCNVSIILSNLAHIIVLIVLISVVLGIAHIIWAMPKTTIIFCHDCVSKN